jgi:hypothetical protein
MAPFNRRPVVWLDKVPTLVAALLSTAMLSKSSK